MHIVSNLHRVIQLLRHVVLENLRAPEPTRLETIAWDEFVRVGGWARAREGGNVRQEGKEYTVADGDVILFKFNV